MAPLCRFYQQGNCRNGANCRFEHPGANTSQNSTPFGAPSNNRFNALSNTSSTRVAEDLASKYKISKDIVKTDLTTEIPQWILSCYGPGRDAPEQLFGGYPREQSFEEIRLHVQSATNPQQAQQRLAELTALHSQAQQQIQSTVQNLDGAIEFVLSAENKHPNRLDIVKQSTTGGANTAGAFQRDTSGAPNNPLTISSTANQNPFSNTAAQSNPFGRGGGTTTSAFGQPSALGQKPSPFGASAPTSAFGQPSQMGAAAPAFGQTSQMGAAAPAFGQTSQIGAPQSAFGQTPSLGAAAPAFGQASTLGQKPNPFGSAPAGPSAFAQAGQGTFGQTGQTQSAFGQPSAMGQKANPFGASATTTQSPFGQPSAPAVANPFAQNGQAASSTTSAFGQPAAASTNPFGQPATTSADQAMDTSAPTPSAQNAPSNPFGQPATGSAFKPAAQNPFGAAPSSQPFRSTQNAPNPFGKPSAPAAAQPQPQTQARNGANSSPYAPGSTKTHPPVSSYIQFRPSPLGGKPLLTSFKNQQVVYKIKINNQFVSPNEKPPEADPRDYPLVPGYMQSDGSWCRIICPDGAPPYYEDTEPDVSAYHPGVKEKYVKMGLTGRFDGGMPEVPPMREDCNWVL